MSDFQKYLHPFEVQMVKKAANKLKVSAEAEPGGLVLAKACEEFLGKTGYRIEYQQKNNPHFREMRTSLNNECGLVICNHPGLPDTFAVLSALDREDVLIMANREVKEQAGKIFGEKYFVSGSHSPNEAIRSMRRALGHIHNGGLFVIFPTGGRKRIFQPGLGFILKHIKPDDMVYCFNVSGADISRDKIPAKYRVLGAAVESASPVIKNPTRLLPHTIEVDEQYTNALEWQNQMRKGAGNREEESLALQKYYFEIFGKTIEHGQ